MKRCPYCAEEIQDAAIVCRFCGRELLSVPPPVVTPAPPPDAPPAEPPSPAPPVKVSRTRPMRIVIWGLLIVGFFLTVSPATVGAGIVMLWVGLALGLQGRLAVKVGGGLLGAVLIGILGMAMRGTSVTPSSAPTRTQAVEASRGTARGAEPAAVASPSASTPSNPSGTQPTRDTTPTPPPVGRQWQYVLDSDAMTGKVTAFASIDSENTVEFGFPYQGAQRGRLTIRRHPRFGNDVIFRIERGQILCPSYDGCTVLVRFDEKPPSQFSANPPADHSSETIFIRNYSRFLGGLRAAKTVRISPPLYQEGGTVFEFDVSGFDQRRFHDGG